MSRCCDFVCLFFLACLFLSSLSFLQRQCFSVSVPPLSFLSGGAGWSPLHLIGAVPNRTTCQRGLSGWWFGGSLPTANCDVLSLLSGRLPTPSRPSPGLPSMRDQMVDIRRRDAVEDSEAGNAAPSNASGRFHS